MRKILNRRHKSIRYKLCLPRGYSESKKYPVIFLTHGAGGAKLSFDDFMNDINLNYLVNSEYKSIQKSIVVIPHCNKNSFFDMFDDLISLAKLIYKRKDVDRDRFNGVGISMGGYTMYQLLMSVNSLWNKAMILCAGGMYWNAPKLNNIELKIIHGEKDQTIYVEEAKFMKNKLDSVGAKSELIIYPNLQHNVWDETWKHEDYFDWLIS